MNEMKDSQMNVFLAGIIQGSLIEATINSQHWREPIKRILASHMPKAEIYCHYSEHPNSITYGMEDIRETLTDGIKRAAECDLLIAFLPGASMGTSIEIYEAYRSGATVVTISPLAANWVIRAYSHIILNDMDAFETCVADGSLARLIEERTKNGTA